MCFDPGLVGAGEEMLALHRAFGFVLLCLSVKKDRSESRPHLCFGFGETTFAQNTLKTEITLVSDYNPRG